ncbi:MAG: CbtB domain-containing protein [Hydrotalea sp.]|nr:CbtB domain-containing protein [Hydrotalea sp.]
MNKLSIITAQHGGAAKTRTNIHAKLLSPATSRFLLGLAMMFLASGGLWLTAFSAQPNLHNAAHDTRHGLNFPCH